MTQSTVSLQLEENIQAILRTELQQAQQNIIQKHTDFILQLGTSLMAQTTAQTLKLINMEAQVTRSEWVGTQAGVLP